MRKSTENQGNTRSPREYYSSKSKGNDHTIQQGFQPNFSTSYQETPMKPSQVPNRLSQPPPRRALPLQSPELCHRDRLGPPWQPSHNLGPFQPPGFVPSGPTSIGRPYHAPRDRMESPQHSDQLQFVPVNTNKIDTLVNRPKYSPPSMFYHTTPQFMRDISHHSSTSHIRRDQATESKVSVPHSGNKTLPTQSQESNKVQSGESRSFVPSIQLRRPPVIPSLNSTASSQHCLRPSDPEQLKFSTSRSYSLPPSTQSSDASSGSSYLIINSPVAPGQEHQYISTPSNNTQIPVVDLNCSTPKRRRDSKDSDNNTKKLCVQGANSGKAQTPKLSARTSLSTSQVMSSGLSPAMERTSKTTDAHLCTEPLDQSACVKRSSTPKSCLKRLPPMGAKQAFINSCQNHIVKLVSSPDSGVGRLKKKVEENDNRDKSSNLLSYNISQKNTNNSPDVLLDSHLSGHIPCNASLIPVKNLNKNKQVGEGQESNSCTTRPASHPFSGSSSRSAIKQKRPSHQRKRPAVPNDVHELFTPDPMTYVVSPTHKLAKPKVHCENVKSPILDKCSPGTATNSSPTDTGSSCRKTQTSTVTSPLRAGEKKDFLSVLNPQVFLPTVALVRVKPELQNDEHCRPKDRHLKNSPISSLGKQLKERGVKSNENITSPLPDNVSSHVSDTNTSASKQILTSPCSQSPLLQRQASEEGTKQVNEEDPIDVELGLSFALDVDLTQSSHSSEEEQLLSLQEMMEHVAKPPDTPEKGAFSEPSTPGHRSSHLKSQPLPSTTNSGIYKNSLDQMLKEINTNKKAKEIETQLISACKEDLLRIAEFEEAEENQEEGISTEQQEFLQRYSLMSNAIREVPPGEVAFNLGKFGQIFNQETLQLRQCMVTPQGAAQKTLLWSSPAQLRLHVTIGLFQEAYEHSFCPSQVTRFLFKMMSVHSERLVSEMMLQALCDIACTAAFQRVKNGNQQFKVWVPSLADVTLVLMNMGVAFVTLFPFEYLQPSFTEGDLLEEDHVKIESPSNNNELSAFPEHNCNSILKYLSYCMGLCPRAYSDDELLLLLTVVGRIGLDPRLILKASVELYPLQYKIVNNIRNWETMLPRICQAYTDLTDDHHNMCLLVQMQPDSTRGKQLRRHLSLSMISKLLDGNCTYRPTEKEFQLSELRPYLPRMQPSNILRAMLSNSSKSQKDKDMATLDQQAYYLCYSLLTLANEASNFQFFPAQQKQQLLNLCSELETHVKCDIRESEKCLYRSKVKDLVARIYTKWQMLLQRTRPLDGKLYDYWQPVLTDTLTSSLEGSTTDNSDDGEGNEVREDSDSEMEEDEQEKETSGSDQNEVVMINGEQEDDERQEGEENVKCDEKLKMADENPVHDLNETEDAVGEGSGKLKHNMPEMEPGVQQECKAIEEKTDAGSTAPTEVEAETVDIRFAPSNENQVPACDSES